MDIGHPTQNGGKIPHVQEAAEEEPDTWFGTVSAKAHMVVDVLVLEAAKKSKVYLVTLSLVQLMGFGDHGNNSLVVSLAELHVLQEPLLNQVKEHAMGHTMVAAHVQVKLT